MAIARNLFFLFSVTLFGLASTVLAISNYNPFTAGPSAFINFYSSFFVATAGIVAIGIFYFKTRKHKNQNTNSFFWPSIRQASLISLTLTMVLMLKGLKILDPLIGLSIIIVLFLSELFFRTKKVTQ